MTSTISDRDSHLPLPLDIVSVVFLGFNTVLPCNCITASFMNPELHEITWIKVCPGVPSLKFRGLPTFFSPCPVGFTHKSLKRKECTNNDCTKQNSSQHQIWCAFLLPPLEASNEGMPWTHAAVTGEFPRWIPWIWVSIPWTPGRLAGSKVRIWPSVSSFDFLHVKQGEKLVKMLPCSVLNECLASSFPWLMIFLWSWHGEDTNVKNQLKLSEMFSSILSMSGFYIGSAKLCGSVAFCSQVTPSAEVCW